MLRVLFCLALCSVAVASAEVRIHDPMVRLLAKPFGIEERIQLLSIDAVHGAPCGGMRIALTLRSSGVKKVVLKQPRFRLEVVGPEGNWLRLGELSGKGITFPLTGDGHSVDHRHVAALESHLDCRQLAGYLRDAARNGRRLRLVGQATMEVGEGDKVEFRKKDLKFELRARTTLSQGFGARSHDDAGELPQIGPR